MTNEFRCTRCKRPIDPDAEDTSTVYDEMDNSDFGSTLYKAEPVAVGYRHRRCPR